MPRDERRHEHEHDEGDDEGPADDRRSLRDGREGTGAGNRDGVHVRACRRSSTRSASSTAPAGVGGGSDHAVFGGVAREPRLAPGGDRLGEQLERPARGPCGSGRPAASRA